MTATKTSGTTTSTLDRLLKPKEAASQLGVCTHTLRRLVLRGEIKAVRLGPRAVRYRTSDIFRLQTTGVAV